ncbi:MAG TPA: metallophosphoesterase family protein [Blastocatellia bacterium]|nr:metallophosphoesterase family protein [Blastocatellia bacterium]
MSTYVIGDVHARSNLLDQLLRDVPWDYRRDKIVFLGDLIDRGSDAPGVVDRIMKLVEENPNVVVLRGNHEQMLLDCLEYGDLQWLIPENGGLATLTGYGIDLAQLQDISDIVIPEEHIEFFKGLPYYHEDEQAIYVHAGLIPGEHPRETDPDVLLWTRDSDFHKGYDGKLCFFGHTPTQYLPKEGRNRRFGIYVSGGCVGIDTSGEKDSPLSCIQVESFTLYQAHPSGVTEVERLRSLKPLPPLATLRHFE